MNAIMQKELSDGLTVQNNACEITGVMINDSSSRDFSVFRLTKLRFMHLSTIKVYLGCESVCVTFGIFVRVFKK